MKRIISAVVAAAALSGLMAGGAHAALVPVEVQFDGGLISAGPNVQSKEVLSVGAPADLTGMIDEDTGNSPPLNADFNFPEMPAIVPSPFSPAAPPVLMTFQVDTVQPAFIGYTKATGALQFNAASNFIYAIPGLAECQTGIDPGPTVTFSTETAAQRPGVRFAAGPTVPTGPGAVGFTWPSIQAPSTPIVSVDRPASVAVCPILDDFLAGAGAIWMSRGIPANPPASPSSPALPSANPLAGVTKKKCKKKRKLRKGKCVKRKKKK